MNEYQRGDAVLAALTARTVKAPLELSQAASEATRWAIVDTLAVALGALGHPAAKLGRAYAQLNASDRGATIWGSTLRAPAEVAALVNGVPLRGYDYNDLYVGKSGGHPSDVIPGLVALAEIRGISGDRLLSSIALAYEINMILLEAIEVESNGWDYPNLIGIGATCAASMLIGLTEGQTSEALAIAAISQLVSDEVESGDLNARGDLTMWKRFNGSHAIRHAVYAATLAEVGVEGAVRPFQGKTAFLSKFNVSSTEIHQLVEALHSPAFPERIATTQFKRWPVGSRAQSAVRAALAARERVGDISKIRRVIVRCDQDAYNHLVAKRADPWHPTSRETADHSLPYIVGSCVLDGQLGVDSFDPARVKIPGRVEFIRDVVSVEPDAKLTQGAAGGYLSSVEVVDVDGHHHLEIAEPPPGHPTRPFTAADFTSKFLENVEPVYGSEATAGILDAVRALAGAPTVSNLTARLGINVAQ